MIDLIERAAEPLALPGPDGDWALDPLRWRLVERLVRRPRPSERLRRLLARRGEAIAASGLEGPRRLAPQDEAARFDAGAPQLDALIRARTDNARLEQTVLVSGGEVAGLFATRRVSAYCPASSEPPLPLCLVARFAVDRRWRSPGLAEDLFAHLLRAAFEAADPDGMPAAVIGFALNPAAGRFFRLRGARSAGGLVDPRLVLVAAADVALPL